MASCREYQRGKFQFKFIMAVILSHHEVAWTRVTVRENRQLPRFRSFLFFNTTTSSSDALFFHLWGGHSRIGDEAKRRARVSTQTSPKKESNFTLHKGYNDGVVDPFFKAAAARISSLNFGGVEASFAPIANVLESQKNNNKREEEMGFWTDCLLSSLNHLS